jgi:hypothetical protein
MSVVKLEHYRFARQQPRHLREVPWQVDDGLGFVRAMRFAIPVSVILWGFIIGLCWEWIARSFS